MSNGSESDQRGVVVQFPSGRTAPPPLPRLPRAVPTPGGTLRYAGASQFSHVLEKRFERNAA